MMSANLPNYPRWQRALFWFGWLLLLVPGYFLWYGFSLIGSLVLVGYNDPVDLVLTSIFALSLLGMLAVAAYTLRRFWHHTSPFRQLVLWLLVGFAGIPVVATAGCLVSYVNLS